jgi:predicted dehydrogenase
MVSDRKLRVGMVGVGGIGRDQHLPAWARVPFAEIAGIADTSDDALRKAGAMVPQARTFRDWKELVTRDDVDVIDICTPNALHAPIGVAALRSGKHVLCEKPLATSAAEVRALRDAAQDNGRLVMAAQNLRFEPASRQLKALSESGILGEVYYARAQWLRRRMLPPRSSFIEKRLSGGGAALDIGVHVLDLAYWFMGAPEPVSVTAVVDAKLAQRDDLSGAWGNWDRSRLDVEDFAAAFIRFANGAALTLEVSWLGFQPEEEIIRLQCYGTRGGLTWPDGLVSGETNRVPWETRVKESPKKSGYTEEVCQFAEAVRGGTPSPVPVEQSLTVARILEAIYRSGQERREVPVE